VAVTCDRSHGKYGEWRKKLKDKLAFLTAAIFMMCKLIAWFGSLIQRGADSLAADSRATKLVST
jgi:hypothetical protein